MNKYQRISVFVALAIYVPLGYQILTGQVKQNLVTWILWVLLDGIAAGSLFVQKGNFQLPAAYTFGGSTIVICIATMRNWSWTMYETVVCGMVVVCVIGWKISGPRLATILSTIAVVLSTIPQLRDTWNEPMLTPTMVYLGYAFVNIMSTIGGKTWTVEERFYPAAMSALCVMIVMISLR